MQLVASRSDAACGKDESVIVAECGAIASKTGVAIPSLTMAQLYHTPTHHTNSTEELPQVLEEPRGRRGSQTPTRGLDKKPLK